jgi:hypothetical protein
MRSIIAARGLVFILALALGAGAGTPAWGLNYDAMAGRIVGALRLQPGERVLIRFDRGHFEELVAPLEQRIKLAGAVPLPPLAYGPVPDFEKILAGADVYLWLPVRGDVPGDQREALARWLDQGGVHREIHFHWEGGSVWADGLFGEHSAALDVLYEAALEIDYRELAVAQQRAIRALRSGVVRVTTRAGTDLSFRIGDRPFNRQDGNASAERAKAARVRVDREIELPAGALRVAPLEETATGRIVVPEARFGDATARGIRFEIENGRVMRVTATQNQAVVEAALQAGGEAAYRFREFGLGLNPKLVRPRGGRVLPYYAYGAGMVRLSLGDNQELGGAVRGGFVRWFFFPDTTVEVNGRTLVQGGRLQPLQ